MKINICDLRKEYCLRIMVMDQGIKNLNLYDVFANIVPGLIFLFGLLVPFNLSAILNAVLGDQVKIGFGVPEFLILITIAFVVGQILQVAGGRFDDDHGFSAFMWKIRGRETETRIDVSDFDALFWDMCRDHFQLSGDFDSHGRLFQALLSFLEERNRSRALRMQALYLLTRGLFMAVLFLIIIYLITAISLYFQYLPEEWHQYLRSTEIIFMFTILAYLLLMTINDRSEEFEKDWIEYTVTECYLEMIDER